MAYKLRYRPTSGGSWSADIDMATSSTTVTGLTNGTQYEFQARRDSTPSWTGSEPTATATPQAPTESNTDPTSVLQTVSMGSVGDIERTTEGVYIVFQANNWEYVEYSFTGGGVVTSTVRVTRSGNNKTLFIAAPRTVSLDITVKPNGQASSAYTVASI